MTEGLELQTAYAQTVRDQDSNKWIVYDESGERIGVMPSCLSEQEAMDVIRFAREHELKAYNVGANVGRERAERAANVRIETIKSQMDSLAEENIRLASILEQHLITEGE